MIRPRAPRWFASPVAAAALSAVLAVPAFVSPARAEGPATKPASKPAAAAPATKPSTTPANGQANVPPRAAPAVGKSTLPPLPAVPKSADDLKAIEARVAEITKKVMPAVVGIQANGGQGSGVIITSDGYVLTAGHVSGSPNQDVTLILADGRRVKARTLGVNKTIDSGLIKITEPGEWPAAEIGESGKLKKGEWVIALGHPGGYRRDRPPVLRLGKVLNNPGINDFLTTDCTLVGGDSGGPLFDLEGRVVGINSRIGPSTLNNMHTPVDTFPQTWDRLARSDAWGGEPQRIAGGLFGRGGPMLGLRGESIPEGGKGARVIELTPGGPAEAAGLKVGDVVTKFDNRPVDTMDDLAEMIGGKRPGNEVPIEVRRDGKTVTLKATLARRPRGG
ncbi:MAG TPA: trypsin-like peptidase domain-containing protein [Humisphaera sp.]